MSTEERRWRGLAEWIRDLVDLADLDPLGGGARLRAVLGTRRARIALDDDVVEVSMRAGRLVIKPPQPTVPADGTGSTTSEVVIALLEGRLEASQALHDGLIQATGNRDAITRIFHAIEILLDVSARVPEMRRLAGDFQHERSGWTAPAAGDRVSTGAGRLGRRDEHELLARLGLIGDG